ncbi:hypothetical protein [uncultured Treponema sp.]|uniref:hypothetical protein n=1 Tax=uncultured Treponema sp. TaxID=162155 RepID=UPI0025E8237C|nr:hypothetical protein [uncultured Treponema sp.]
MRKFAKISAVLAAMVLALAFVGCKSDDDDDDVSSSTLGISGTEKAYWISVEEEKDGSVKYAKSYIEFTSDTTAKNYKYFDQEDVAYGEAPSVGYFVETEATFTTSGNTLTVTGFTAYEYIDGEWDSEKLEAEGWSDTYTISGSEMTETFTDEKETETTKYAKVTEKPTAPYRK